MEGLSVKNIDYKNTLDMLNEYSLTSSNIQKSDKFGSAIALSGDGKTAVISSPGKEKFGAVYVFEKTDNEWIEVAELEASDRNQGDYFGYSVSISFSGDVILVSSYKTKDKGGSAYIFVKQEKAWREEAKLTSSSVSDCFGSKVAISSNGKIVLVGAPGYDSDTGAVYIFTKDQQKWIEVKKIMASDAKSKSRFGFSLDLSADQSTLIVGAYRSDGKRGSAYIFRMNPFPDKEISKLISTERTAKSYFGYSVALSSDGSKALVGACGEQGHKGSCYLFVKDLNNWREYTRLTAQQGDKGDKFGCSVSLTDNLILVGASGANENKGSAYLFNLEYDEDTGFTEVYTLTPSSLEEGDRLSQASAVSSDSSMILLGAPEAEDGRGKVYNLTLPSFQKPKNLMDKISPELLREKPILCLDVEDEIEEPLEQQEDIVEKLVEVPKQAEEELQVKKKVQIEEKIERQEPKLFSKIKSLKSEEQIDIYCLSNRKLKEGGVVLTISSLLPNIFE